MRTPEEILKNIVSNDKWVYYDGSMHVGDAIPIHQAIKEVQKEAYNEAIDDATKCDEDVVEWKNEEKYISVSAIKKLKK